MIDVHVLTLPNDRQDWFKQCMMSLKDEPVNVHILDGVVGNIGQARVNGFTQGDAKFVSYVDPDDYVLPGGFAAGIQALEENPSIPCAYTYEYRLGINESIRSYNSFHRAPHHLLMFRRELIERYFSELVMQKYTPEPWLLRQLGKDFGHRALWEITEPHYVWRLHDKSWTWTNRQKVAESSRSLRG